MLKEINDKVKIDIGREALTDRIPHPVGTNAKMQAKMSGTDKSVNITATAKPANANKKETPWMKRNNS